MSASLRLAQPVFFRVLSAGMNNSHNRKEFLMDHKDFTASLAMNTLDDIPNPKSDAKDIVGLVKSSGKVTGYQLSDGRTVSKEEGVAMAKSGQINGVGVAHRGDSEYLKSIPDGTEGNNLANLPSVSAKADL